VVARHRADGAATGYVQFGRYPARLHHNSIDDSIDDSIDERTEYH